MGWVVNATPRPLYRRGREPVPIVQEVGWEPGPVWKGAKNLASPPGFDPGTVQPVASRYTEWAIPGHEHVYNFVYHLFVTTDCQVSATVNFHHFPPFVVFGFKYPAYYPNSTRNRKIGMWFNLEICLCTNHFISKTLHWFSRKLATTLRHYR